MSFLKLDIEIDCIIQYMLSHNSIEQEFIKCKYQIIINDNDSVDRKGSIISIFTSEPSLLKNPLAVIYFLIFSIVLQNRAHT